MISWDKLKKGTVILLIGGGLFAAALWAGANIYQPSEKSDEIYTAGLNAYNNKDYSKSYYIFSKIVFSSNLKPLAIYRQALSADKVEDFDSAVKQYKLFLFLYPKHVMSIRARYNLAQDLMKNNPNAAKKEFEKIIAKFPNSDYAIASEYYSGTIDLKKYENEKIFPLSAKSDIQSHFRHYLKKAPSGRLVSSVINDWTSMDVQISNDDYYLMAKSLYKVGDYQKAEEFVKKADLKSSWPIAVQNAIALKNLSNAKFLMEWGLKENSEYVDKEDIYDAINSYMETVPSKYQTATDLFGIAKSRGKDYLLAIKCRYSSSDDKFACYKNLYLWYPAGSYTDEAQSQMFLYMVRNNNTNDAQRIGADFLNKYKDSSKYAPQVMYYMGKLSEKTRAYRDYVSYYRGVISKYPDNYYAYRSYLRLNHSKTPIIATTMHQKDIEFPYERKHAFLDKLLKLKDYEILEEYTSYDDFVKSWTLYQRGEISKAMLVARDAMDKLSEKPERTDLRWRLVYPEFYYNELRDYSDRAGTVFPLMMALTREESYFNPAAQSSAGARGLMQLMPATAEGTAKQQGISAYDLFSPQDNILLGNYHYGSVKTQLNGDNILSVAAYNSGAGAVNQWKKTLNYTDTDSFIEQIPYPETSDYVKKVFRSYWNYVRLYSGND
ncbi:MAG: transglycosylase SLT domain-containing protein [Candidatus Gastranaerophilaceae bacterium]|nr:transglycosylase SLT domain-containing protein [Candidatus Gastranaerophilaceae bacterium]